MTQSAVQCTHVYQNEVEISRGWYTPKLTHKMEEREVNVK